MDDTRSRKEGPIDTPRQVPAMTVSVNAERSLVLDHDRVKPLMVSTCLLSPMILSKKARNFLSFMVQARTIREDGASLAVAGDPAVKKLIQFRP
jgi:hypothetical protein